MGTLSDAFRQFEEWFVQWAEECPDIRAAIVLGSRARANLPADEWSDMDIWMIVTDPALFINSTDWLSAFGKVRLTFLEPTLGGETERRVLFDGGMDVDFVPTPVEAIQHILDAGVPDGEADIIRRGVRVLVDKDGLAKRLIQQIPVEVPVPSAPTESEFINVVNDFWFHAVWVAKKLRRGELWTAQGGLNYLRVNCMLPVVEWHARAVHGADDTWHSGRFLEKWADPRVVDGLRGAYAHYDSDDVWRALLAVMDLFRWIASETAKKLGYVYLSDGDEYVTGWVNECWRVVEDGSSDK